MNNNSIPPTLNEAGDETHPAWALIGASRVSSTPGAVLFDSDIKHQHSIVVRITRAKRRRNLLRDWLFGHRTIIEVQMSEAQWASFVSSMNVGDGVPCTMLYHEGEGHLPGVTYEPRLRVSFDEVRSKAQEAFAEVKAAFEAYEQKKNVGNLRNLRSAIKNAPANIAFAGESLSEHAENVTERMRADVEAMVVTKAQQLGIDPAELDAHELMAGDEG